MSNSEIVQVVAAIATCLAALASCAAAFITLRQYKLQQDEKIKKYRPFFKIKKLDETPQGYFFSIINEGYPFFSISNVSWDGSGAAIIDFFNVETRESQTKGRVSTEVARYENLLIIVHTKDYATTEGFIKVSGFDIEHNDFHYKTPLISINNGKIDNGERLTYQNLVVCETDIK